MKNVHVQEYGLESIESLFIQNKTPISISEDIEISIPGGYETRNAQWKSYSTTIPASKLFELYNKHGAQLFSANIRDYLGSRQSTVNINYGIKESIKNDPNNFWVYNNGITALVNDYTILAGSDEKITIKGISIVNGAQTTGAIGSLASVPDNNAFVPIRFVQCVNQQIVQNIIRYNNSQNSILPSDFRSKDPIQDKLREQFKRYLHFTYHGGRRGGEDDLIRRPSNTVIPFDTISQILVALYGYPILAYNQKKDIFEIDRNYALIFNEKSNAEHIIFAFSLSSTIQEIKQSLKDKERSGSLLTSSETKNHEYLKHRGSNYLLISAISACLEDILNMPITNLSYFRFIDNSDFSALVSNWKPIINSCIAFNQYLTKPLENGLKNQTEVKTSIDTFKSFITSTVDSNRGIYDNFKVLIDTSPM